RRVHVHLQVRGDALRAGGAEHAAVRSRGPARPARGSDCHPEVHALLGRARQPDDPGGGCLTGGERPVTTSTEYQTIVSMVQAAMANQVWTIEALRAQ